MRLVETVIFALGLMLFGHLAAAEVVAGPDAKPPLVIAKQGNFYVGGKEFPTETGSKLIDAMYVEYQIPAERKHPFPIIFIHGGGGIGSSYWSTPDEREGWATLFLRKGYAVYVVDLPTQGRSPHFEPADGATTPSEPGSLEPRATRSQDYNLWPQARYHSRFPGTGKPGDPAYEQLRAKAQASVETPMQTGEEGKRIRAHIEGANRDAVAALLDRIGPAILVTHSRSGPTGWVIADARPRLVKAVVSVEPSGPPFFDPPSPAEPDSPIVRPWGIAYLPMEFSPPINQTEDFAPFRTVAPEAPDLVACSIPRGPQRKLVNLVDVPVLILQGQASYHAPYDHCTANFLTSAGVAADFVRLADRGITGNGHLMMIETNNEEIANLAAAWLSERLD